MTMMAVCHTSGGSLSLSALDHEEEGTDCRMGATELEGVWPRERWQCVAARHVGIAASSLFQTTHEVTDCRGRGAEGSPPLSTSATPLRVSNGLPSWTSTTRFIRRSPPFTTQSNGLPSWTSKTRFKRGLLSFAGAGANSRGTEVGTTLPLARGVMAVCASSGRKDRSGVFTTRK